MFEPLVITEPPSFRAAAPLPPVGAEVSLARPVRIWLPNSGWRPFKLATGLVGRVISLDLEPLIAGFEPPRVVEVDFGSAGRYWLDPALLQPILAD